MSFLAFTDPTQSLEEPWIAPKEDAEFRDAQPSISHMIPLADLYYHFIDLASFVHHPDFDHFAYCWMEYQYNIIMSQHVACRPQVNAWLVSMSAQLRSIVARYTFVTTEDNPEASTLHIKSAYERLIHRFGVLHKLLDLIERGRAVGQSPQEVALPFYNQILQYTLNQRQNQASSPFIYNPIDQPPFSCDESTPSLSMLSLSSPIPRAQSSTSSFRSLACMEVMPYLDDSCASSPHIHPLSLVLPRTDPLPSTSWSTPVTPNVSESTRLFWSCPVSPSHPPQVPSTVTTTASASSSSIQSSITSPLSLLNIEEEPITPLELTDVSKTSEDTNDDELNSEYQQSQEDEEETETPPKKTDTTSTVGRRQRRVPLIKPTKVRTATSYDNATTHYLMSMFFTVYSERDKLTKEQRQQVVKHTGLNPRNVTYWFSNHKRRFQSALFLFKRLVAEGRIQSYQDFVKWRREQGMSEDMVETGDF